ncbi:protein of unknown function (plasmid) [Cupriavidus taiwanensis]|uniref:Uncharacterized protein n=1 Tax=Cupriavidus taiwanensis TaxID=164546 RepID=A0A375IRG1_9BURK|nr:protein of unknown function [Cupriavidus taiwanensis]
MRRLFCSIEALSDCRTLYSDEEFFEYVSRISTTYLKRRHYGLSVFNSQSHSSTISEHILSSSTTPRCAGGVVRHTLNLNSI